MVTLPITSEQYERAKILYEFKALHGSIKEGASNIYGALGEIVTQDFFKQTHIVSYHGTYNYDLIISGYRIEVKTKRTTVLPKPNYFASISCHNTRQQCHFYFFLRVLENFTKGYLLGYISPHNFYNKAIYKNKGDIDTNGFVFKDNCYNLPISDLNKFTLNQPS